MKFQIFKLDFKKAEELFGFGSNCQNLLDHQKNTYPCFIDYAKVFDCVDHNELWKILKEIGIAEHLTCLLRNLRASQEAMLEQDMGQWAG